MAKVRVHQLKKELNLDYPEIAAICKQLNIEYKAHPTQVIQPSSTLEEPEVIRVRQAATKGKAGTEKPSKKTAASKTEKPKAEVLEKATPIKEKKPKPIAEHPRPKTTPKESHKEVTVKSKTVKEPQTALIEQQPTLSVVEPIASPPETTEEQPPIDRKVIELVANLTVKDLAEIMDITVADVIKTLFLKGIVTTVNQVLELETAEMIVSEFGMEARLPSANALEGKRKLKVSPVRQPVEDDASKLKPRSPVVTVMGHVDHGKTSLLDYIRKARVTESEAGGITQSIGAYQVEVGERQIVFIDTPGHEAFTAMRARGARATDIVVLVVAADDGIMPQTIEAIHHAKASDVQIIVAINKIDKEGADPDRIKQQLTEHELVPEEWGGDTVIVPVSAKSGKGVDDLLEMLSLVADLMELKANPDRAAEGVVIESHLDKGTGAVGDVLIQSGTLHRGDHFVAGSVYGKVRAMHNDLGKRMKNAGPATPVEIIGFNEVPNAGDILRVVKDEKTARRLAAERKENEAGADQRLQSRISLSNLYENVKEGKLKELKAVIRADTQGSVDAIIQSLNRLSNEKIQLKILHAATGEISESDILLASASNALAICFNVKPDANARRIATQEQIEIRYYEIIYKLIEDIEKAMEGLLEPEMVEIPLGHAEVRATFRISKTGMVAGSYILDGKCERNAFARVWRDTEIIATGKITSLKRFKEDVKEVTTGYECGISLNNFNDFQEGDRLEIFLVQATQGAKART